MTDPAIQAAMDATWPAAGFHRTGAWLIRKGEGGGSRVSAATAEGAVTAADIPAAEAAMHALGQSPLFLIRGGDDALDQLLAARGYTIMDPVAIYGADCAWLADPPPPPLSAFPLWPPLEIQRRIWAEGGIGPARLAVMDRAGGPKTTLLGRSGARCSGAAFVACHAGTAMLHALEVVPAARRQGSGERMIRMAALWAQQQAANRLLLAVTRANVPACRLYAKLGMEIVGQYHYRKK